MLTWVQRCRDRSTDAHKNPTRLEHLSLANLYNEWFSVGQYPIQGELSVFL